MTEEKKEKKEVLVDFEGTAGGEFDKALLDVDTYEGQFVSCEMIEAPVYEGTGTTKRLVFSVSVNGCAEDTEIPFYVNPVIKKSGGQKGYSNSKLFDLLVASGELDNAKANHAVLETFEGLFSWIEKAFVGKKCKFLTKTTNLGKDNAYSVVDKIIKFEQSTADPVVKREEVEK